MSAIACECSSFELRKHISFRDYLIAHPLEARRLTEHKRRLAFVQHLSRSQYIAAKSDLVAEISTAALEWYSGRSR
jgi:GrpB-like predicted nucleotidyltransferase (UPF0157 family)